MTAETQTREKVVANAISEISHIATLPEITLKIIELVEDPSSTAQDLHNVISNDPALCSRILKVVNSAFYGLPGQIGSINRAIVLLGLNAVKNIAIAASLAKLFRGGALTPNFTARSLWDHSVATAVASRMLAKAIKFGMADEAFLAGLIHDIGVVVEIQADRHKLIEVLGRIPVTDDGVPQASMLQVEEEIFGATHQDFGRGLCEKWKFPASFAKVTGFHHRPMDVSPEARSLVTLVSVADRMAAGLPGSFRLDLQSLQIPSEALDQLKLTRETVDEIRERLPEEVAAVDQTMSS